MPETKPGSATPCRFVTVKGLPLEFVMVTLIAPLGEVRENRATRFVWRPVSKAEHYLVVVVDTTGAELFASETRDTALVLPDSVHLAPGRAYLWWVQARLADQSTVTAVTQRLVVSPR